MEKKNLIKVIYFFFTIVVLLLSYIYANFDQVKNLMDENNDIVFSNLMFDHAELVTNIFSGDGYYQYRYGVKYYLTKLPFLPLIISFLASISKNLYFIYFIKNLVFFSIIFFSLNFFCKVSNKNKIFFASLLTCLFIIPHNLHVLLNITFADTIVASLLPSLFLLLVTKNQNKYFFISLIIFALYLTKTSMFFLCVTLPFIIIFLEKDNKRKILPILGLLLAISIWGVFGVVKTGTFSFGSKILSVSSEGMTIALNKNFHKFYPEKSVDLIEYSKPDKKEYNNEWEIYDYYKKINSIYLENNLDRYIKDTFIKIKVILFNIQRDSSFPDNKGNFSNPIKISFLINKIFFNLSIIISIIVFLKNFKKLRSIKLEIYLLSIISLNSFPLIIGWATAKHLTGMTLVSIIYIFIKLSEKKFIKTI